MEEAVKDGRKWYASAKKHGEEPRTLFEVVSLAYKLDVFGVAEEVLGTLDKRHQNQILSLSRKDVKTLRDNLAHAKDLTQGFPERWQRVFALAAALDRATEAITTS